jgi:hypothetical protein
MGSAFGWVKDKLRKQELPEEVSQDPGLEAGASERESARVLQEMGELDRQLAAGTISLEAYRAQWMQLEQRMQNNPGAQNP